MRNVPHLPTPTETPKRAIAIDWSGDATQAGQRRRIWVADWIADRSGGTVSLSAGRTRGETVAWVIAQAEKTPELVVGFDFSFSFTAWFVRQQNASTAEELWAVVAAQGESWLRDCRPPFWGRPAQQCPQDHRGPKFLGYRATEREVGERIGRLPTSTFQIGGAGAVGTGSLRGMPWLLKLKQAGFSIWPFDEPRLPLVVEIYPRVFTGKTRVSNAEARSEHLQRREFAKLAEDVLAKARTSPDAFDALCSALGMAAHAEQFAQLQQAREGEAKLEGAIWQPA